MSLRTVTVNGEIYVSLADCMTLLQGLQGKTETKPKDEIVLPPLSTAGFQKTKEEHVEKQELTKKLEVIPKKEQEKPKQEVYFSTTEIAEEIGIHAKDLNDFLCEVGFIKRKTKKKKHTYFLYEEYKNKDYETYIQKKKKNWSNKMKFSCFRFTIKGKEKILALYHEHHKTSAYADKLIPSKKEKNVVKHVIRKDKPKSSPMEIGEKREIQKLNDLIWYLRYGKVIDKRLAASAINKLSDQYKEECNETIPYLINNLYHEAPQVRQYALNALGNLSLTSEDIRVMKEILANEDKEYNKKIVERIEEHYISKREHF